MYQPATITGIVRSTFSKIQDTLQRIQHFPTVIPPRNLRRSRKSIGEYIHGGQFQMGLAQAHGGLTSETMLLDIGCGDGRFPSALAKFFTTGSYTTIEVNKGYVDYLGGTLGKKNVAFRFVHADLWHSYYNPQGKHKTNEYVFPFPDASFDLVYLNSIFTHFLPTEIEHYLREIHRILKPGGTVYATYFPVNDESLSLDAKGMGEKDLTIGRPKVMNHKIENYWIRDNDVLEHVVGIDEVWLKDAYRKHGLKWDKAVYGTWCGRTLIPGKMHQQDIVIGKKGA